MVKAGKVRKEKYLQAKLLSFKKQLSILFKSSLPYLKPRYWVIYTVAFGLGFYLWGPTHGIARIRNWRLFQSEQSSRVSTIEILQREIEQLKKEINMQKLKVQETALGFDPVNLSRPAFGEIIQRFEWVNFNNTWRLHTGIDMVTAQGSNIMASAEGVVKEVTETSRDGLTVILEHGDGWESVYGNLGEVNVKKGDQIIKGTIIGISGGRSCHSKKPGFHFEITHNQQPVDPEKIIKGL